MTFPRRYYLTVGAVCFVVRVPGQVTGMRAVVRDRPGRLMHVYQILLYSDRRLHGGLHDQDRLLRQVSFGTCVCVACGVHFLGLELIAHGPPDLRSAHDTSLHLLLAINRVTSIEAARLEEHREEREAFLARLKAHVEGGEAADPKPGVRDSL